MKDKQNWRILLLFLLAILLLVVLFIFVLAGIEKPSATPIMNQSYFPQAQEMIQGARKYIHILFLEIHKDGTTTRLMNDLIAANKRGVEVKILLDDRLFCNKESLAYLSGQGIEVRLDSPDKFLHHKLMIVDGSKVLIGSTNWSYMSLKYNNESNVFIEDPPISRLFSRNSTIANYYERYFQLLWKDPTQEPKLPPLKTESIVPLAVKDDYYNELHNSLNKASKRIHIVMYGMRYYNEDSGYPDSIVNTIFNDLIAAKKRGVEVKVLVEKSDYNEVLNEFNEEATQYLKENGVEIRYDPLEVITHAKLIIIDDATILGSSNWGYGGLKAYLGSNILLLDAQVTTRYEEYFQRLWTQGSEG